MAQQQPDPPGCKVVKISPPYTPAQWVVLLTPRDRKGRLTGMGFLSDPDAGAAGRKVPMIFARRGQAITYALIHALQEEVEVWRARAESRAKEPKEDSQPVLAGV